MLTLFFVIIFVSGIIMLARSVLFWLYFIQLKSYRFDRIWHEMRQHAFWRLIFSKHRVVVLFLLALWMPLLLNSYADIGLWMKVPNIFIYFVLFIIYIYFVVYLAQTIYGWKRHILKLPALTIKTAILFCVPIGVELLVLSWPSFCTITIINDEKAMFLFFQGLLILYGTVLPIELLQPFIVLGIFALTYAPNIFLRRYFINRAKIKIQAHKNLIVIGITGSYGKTSTKEFLAHILSKNFKVLKTPAHINVDIGVAKVILGDLITPKIIPSEAKDPLQLRMVLPRSAKAELAMTNDRPHEIFIVEMGAYRKGEIRKICNLTKPQYAIITGLSDQHLELFGSLRAIVEAKFELIEAISGQNGVVANAESKPLIIEFERRGWKPLWYGASERSQLKARHTTFTENGTEFQINNTPFRTSLIGSAALNNLLGAITMARLLGMDLGDISRAISDIPFVPHTMEPHLTPNNALIIDDTYNANTEGVITALNDLKYFNRPKKIFVFGEVIELGEKTKNDHIQIAKTIARTTARVMLLPSRMRQVMYDTLAAEGYDSTRILDSRDQAHLKDIINSDTVILFEGKGGEEIIDKIHLNYNSPFNRLRAGSNSPNN